MAEYDLTPLFVDEDLQGTYELLKNYFIRGNNLFNVVADYLGEDNFSMDVVRSYSFVASTHRASIHFSGLPVEGGTKIGIHVKSVAEKDELEREIHDRLEVALGHLLEQKRGRPVVDPNAVEDPAKEKRKLIISIVVLAVIALGTAITGVFQQYSGFWSV